MNAKLAFAVVVCFVLSVGTIVMLFALSGEMKDQHNSFLRQFPPHPVMDGDTLDIRYNYYYIAGGTRNTVYLGNYKVPLHVLKVNLNNPLDTQFVSLKIKTIRDQKFWSAHVAVDSPYYYLSDGAVPVIFKGDINSGEGQRFPRDSVYFQSITPLSPGAFAVQSLSSQKKENILGKVTAWPPYQRFDDLILQKQIDGVFCTDGMLNYDRETKQLVYLYFYRNEYTVMDTSLQILYRANTIDTNFRAKISTATIESGRTHMMNAPARPVNKKSCVSDVWLFVNSGLMAKNEYKSEFDSGDVIDAYDLRNGRYRFSFYLYHYQGKQKMTDFKVFGDRMVVLYGKSLQVYRLRPKIFRKDILVQ